MRSVRLRPPVDGSVCCADFYKLSSYTPPSTLSRLWHDTLCSVTREKHEHNLDFIDLAPTRTCTGIYTHTYIHIPWIYWFLYFIRLPKGYCVHTYIKHEIWTITKATYHQPSNRLVWSHYLVCWEYVFIIHISNIYYTYIELLYCTCKPYSIVKRYQCVADSLLFSWISLFLYRVVVCLAYYTYVYKFIASVT